MSYLYTGTPALKTDFTRTGKRTYRGAINDGINAVTRYYINNLTDGYYHDCLDVATLKLMPFSSTFKKRRIFFTPLKIYLFIVCLLTFVVKLAVEQYLFTGLANEDFSPKQTSLYYMLVLGTLACGSYYIVNNGRSFIDDSTRYV
mgnify:CR=1 FL=1